MKYCPLCAAEYREDREKCSSCNAALVGSLETEEVRRNPPRPLWIGGSSAEFDVVAGALREACIPALVEEGPPRILQRFLKLESQICVLQSDLQRALQTAAAATAALGNEGRSLQRCYQCNLQCAAALAVCPNCSATLIAERPATQRIPTSEGTSVQAVRYCPLCDAEYSPNYQRCTVCGVDLAPEEMRGKPFAERELKEKIVIIWRGGDPVAVSNVVSLLREAGIRHHVESTHDYFVFGLAMPRPKYIVRVLQGDTERAEVLLSGIVDSPFFGAEISSDFPENGPGQPGSVAHRWNPASATVEIWSGDDAAMGKLLEDCLQENRIGLRREGREPGKLRLFVTAGDEAHAREILREIREGTPLA